MQEGKSFIVENLFSGLISIVKPETVSSLLQALSELHINEECSVITLRQCQMDSQGFPMLELQATWSKGDVSVWQEALLTDDESLAKVWILSGGPPLFIEDFEEFALFTDASRKFYLDQGVMSLYRILIKREGQCTAMLTVMWTSPRSFSAEYRAMVEFVGWMLLPVLENIYSRQENKRLVRTVAQLEQKLLETESSINILAHDLKQPLTSIVTTASLLNNYVDRMSKDQITSKLERVLQTSKGMSDWISSILLLAQVRKEQEIKMTNVQMVIILSDTIDQLQEFIISSSAQIDYSTLEKDIEILGQPIWITHIWTNLINNACKYGGPSPIITISAENLQNIVRFVVRDNGPGIPQDKLNLVFEPFTRFAPDVPGTGIGLTTVKILVEKMGGSIGVESDSTGTTFWFTLRKHTH